MLAKSILDPNGDVEKEYLVRVNVLLDESSHGTQMQVPSINSLTPSYSSFVSQVRKLREGIYIGGELFSAKSVDIINENQLRFILTEGKHRQIRRMCEQVGIKVVALKRVRIGNIKLRSLPVGQWRYLQSFDKL
jgi:23S rRNA pseudouridine2604 synthase